jgi:hypothetical protein
LRAHCSSRGIACQLPPPIRLRALPTPLQLKARSTFFRSPEAVRGPGSRKVTRVLDAGPAAEISDAARLPSAHQVSTIH